MATIRTTNIFDAWFAALRDRHAKARIQMRIDRLIGGNPGQHRVLTAGVSELKIDFGAGYRVYYTQRRNEIIILLIGGDKTTQNADIQLATKIAKTLEN